LVHALPLRLLGVRLKAQGPTATITQPLGTGEEGALWSGTLRVTLPAWRADSFHPIRAEKDHGSPALRRRRGKGLTHLVMSPATLAAQAVGKASARPCGASKRQATSASPVGGSKNK
jgi:hypothetical protein